jgi:hypothetical protein
MEYEARTRQRAQLPSAVACWKVSVAFLTGIRFRRIGIGGGGGRSNRKMGPEDRVLYRLWCLLS